MDCKEYIAVGMIREERSSVSENNTAQAMGSGSLPVYATPAMTALMEQAAANLVEGCLPEGWTSVGVALNIVHTAATPQGLEVRAAAEVTAIDGRSIAYRVTAWDEMGIIGSGTHERVAVPAEHFLKKAEGKLTAGKI